MQLTVKQEEEDMKMARLYFKNGHTCWTWHILKNGRVLVNKDFYDTDGYYKADASYKVEMSKDNLNNSINMAKELLPKVIIV